MPARAPSAATAPRTIPAFTVEYGEGEMLTVRIASRDARPLRGMFFEELRSAVEKLHHVTDDTCPPDRQEFKEARNRLEGAEMAFGLETWADADTDTDTEVAFHARVPWLREKALGLLGTSADGVESAADGRLFTRPTFVEGLKREMDDLIFAEALLDEIGWPEIRAASQDLAREASSEVER